MTRLLERSASDLLQGFAAANAYLAAGSAAALTGAVAAALVEMVAKLTVAKADGGSERLRERYLPYRSRASEIAAEVETLRTDLQAMVQTDAELVRSVILTKQQCEAERDASSALQARLHAMLLEAVDLPLQVARAALRVAELAGELSVKGYRTAAYDVIVAGQLARSAAEGALTLAKANLEYVAAQTTPADPAVENARVGLRDVVDQLERLQERARTPATGEPATRSG